MVGRQDRTTLFKTVRDFHYLLSLGQSDQDWTYETDSKGQHGSQVSYRENQSFFPFWNHQVHENTTAGNRLETSSVLGILYDTRHEQDKKKDHDYVRRQVLWRLFHYEKLNGDMSTDIFPAITVDSYKNGYYKCSFLWRLFRYENDPKSGKKKLDLLFIPLKR